MNLAHDLLIEKLKRVKEIWISRQSYGPYEILSD